MHEIVLLYFWETTTCIKISRTYLIIRYIKKLISHPSSNYMDFKMIDVILLELFKV